MGAKSYKTCCDALLLWVQRSPPLRRGKLAGPRGKTDVAVGAGLERPSARPADPGMMVAFDKVLVPVTWLRATSSCSAITALDKDGHGVLSQIGTCD